MATIIGGVTELNSELNTNVNNVNIDSQSVRDFFDRHWPRKTALPTRAFYEWQFAQPPSHEGEDHCMVAVDGACGKILGVMGVTARPFYLNNRALRGAELTTWIVDEARRTSGVGAKILRKILSQYDVLIGMGISDMALPIFMKSGFRYVRAIPRFVKVFNFDAVAPFAQYDASARKLVKRWANRAVTPWETATADPDAVNQLNADIQQNFHLFSRSADFLRWRYADHPIFQYEQFLVRRPAGRGPGVLVCLREETSIENLRMLHVADFIGDAADMPAALSFVHDYCLENEFHIADFYCTTSRINRFFIHAGWFSINDDLCFQFPHLFHPLEYRTPPTTSLIYWSKVDFLEMADLSKLYITKQDADLDRPTFETLNTPVA